MRSAPASGYDFSQKRYRSTAGNQTMLWTVMRVTKDVWLETSEQRHAMEAILQTVNVPVQSAWVAV